MIEVPFHYQFRIIVIGDTMVGKSSLLRTLSEGVFGDMEPTVGVDFFSKIIEIKPKKHRHPQKTTRSRSESINNSHVKENIIIKLQIWDTAGQERFRSIVTSYYRNSIGIVLVYDITNRDSYDHLVDWFTEARRHIEPSPSPTLSPITQIAPEKSFNYPSNYPITSTPNNNSSWTKIKRDATSSTNGNFHMNNNDTSDSLQINSISDQDCYNKNDLRMVYLVLGCKTDLESQRQVSFEDGQAFANLHGFKFIETSSKTNYNVNKAFQTLAEEIYDRISECSRTKTLHRTQSGGHLTFEGTSQFSEGIRLGPLIEGHGSRRLGANERSLILEAQPVRGVLGGCC